MNQRYCEIEYVRVDQLNSLLAAGFTVIAADHYSLDYSCWDTVLLLGPANISPHSVLAGLEFR